MKRPLRQLRKDVQQAIESLTDYPIGVMIGPVLRQRSDYTHFLRVQYRTKFIEIGLMPHEVTMPADKFISTYVEPSVTKLVAAIDPGRV